MYHWKFLEPMVAKQFTTICPKHSHYIHQVESYECTVHNDHDYIIPTYTCSNFHTVNFLNIIISIHYYFVLIQYSLHSHRVY